MSAEFSGGYGSIQSQPGGNQDESRSSGGYQSEDDMIFQSLSDTIISNIFLIDSNVQALKKICKQLGTQLQEVLYDKMHRIQQGTNKLAADTTACLNLMINLQGESVTERKSDEQEAKFLPPKDTWQCEICLIRNNHDVSKCAVCQTEKPGTSSAPAGSWKCLTCMTRNKAAVPKCVACKMSKPGTHGNGGSWECPTCLKFAAYETSKPGAESTGGTSSIFSTGGFNVSANAGVAPKFQFGSNTNTPSGGFNFSGTGPPTACSSPFVFGGATTPASGTANPSATSTPFNFSGNTAANPQINVGQSSNQPALFNMGASQTIPNNSVYKKAVRRRR